MMLINPEMTRCTTQKKGVYFPRVDTGMHLTLTLTPENQYTPGRGRACRERLSEEGCCAAAELSMP